MSQNGMLLAIIVVLFLAWIITGGPADPSARYMFVSLPRSPFPEDDGPIRQPTKEEQLQGEVSSLKQKVTQLENEVLYSPLREKLYISSITGEGTYGTAGNEYISIRAGYYNKEDIILTGLRVKAVKTGESMTIGEGARLPYLNVVNSKETITLRPGETAYLISGNSPIGTSFQTNLCTGYFAQYQNFVPSLPRQCPRIDNANLPVAPNTLDDDCLSYIRGISRCTAHTDAFPEYLADSCKRFITEKGNYQSCVTTYRNDPNFFSGSWWIYFNKSNKIWSAKKDTILLLDRSGKIIDSEEYSR